MKVIKIDNNDNSELVFMEYVEELQGLFLVTGLNKFNEVDGVYYKLVDDYYRPNFRKE